MLPQRKLGSSSASHVSLPLTDERRFQSDRVAANFDAIILWSAASQAPVRYRALDISDGGMRICSMLPLREGSIGTILSTVPHSAVVNREFMVVWSRKSTHVDSNGVAFEAGLRFSQP